MARVLIAHNRYRQSGGEETAVEQDVAMLKAAGHDVTVVMADSAQIRSSLDKLRTATHLADNADGVRLVADALARSRAEILHVHNFFPLLSPGIYRAARASGAGVVQTLHNYRTVCAGALLMRNGSPCHKCLHDSPWWGAVHRCYHGSTVGSAALAHMIAHHRRIGTWQRDVDRYIVLSDFARARFVEAGFPEDRMVVRPNAVDDPGPPRPGVGRNAIYVGRLSEEKGVRVLIEAARMVDGEILMIGEGNLGDELRARAPANVQFLGQRPRAEVRSLIAEARVLVLPSICYEGSPMTLSEAYAAGTPVVGSRLGSLVELIEDGRTGLHARPGDAADLARQVSRILTDDRLATAMRHGARACYEENLAPQRALLSLEAAYRNALCAARAQRTPGP